MTDTKRDPLNDTDAGWDEEVPAKASASVSIVPRSILPAPDIDALDDGWSDPSHAKPEAAPTDSDAQHTVRSENEPAAVTALPSALSIAAIVPPKARAAQPASLDALDAAWDVPATAPVGVGIGTPALATSQVSTAKLGTSKVSPATLGPTVPATRGANPTVPRATSPALETGNSLDRVGAPAKLTKKQKRQLERERVAQKTLTKNEPERSNDRSAVRKETKRDKQKRQKAELLRENVRLKAERAEAKSKARKAKKQIVAERKQPKPRLEPQASLTPRLPAKSAAAPESSLTQNPPAKIQGWMLWLVLATILGLLAYAVTRR